jgi:hypothetical protein
MKILHRTITSLRHGFSLQVLDRETCDWEPLTSSDGAAYALLEEYAAENIGSWHDDPDDPDMAIVYWLVERDDDNTNVSEQ